MPALILRAIVALAAVVPAVARLIARRRQKVSAVELDRGNSDPS